MAVHAHRAAGDPVGDGRHGVGEGEGAAVEGDEFHIASWDRAEVAAVDTVDGVGFFQSLSNEEILGGKGRREAFASLCTCLNTMAMISGRRIYYCYFFSCF